MRGDSIKRINTKLLATFGKIAVPVVGLLSLVWFLVRVIPKPSRAGYPCMQAAAPMASAFVLWLLGLTASALAFMKSKQLFRKANYTAAIGLFAVGMLTVLVTTFAETDSTPAMEIREEQPVNDPIGEPQGIVPGKVVWVWNPDATNEECTNSYRLPGDRTDDDGWFLDKNNNMEVIDQMVRDAISMVTEEEDIPTAWEKLFTYHNEKKARGAHGYQEGETIYIKLNATSTWGFGQSWGNIQSDMTVSENKHYGMAETSPHLVLAVLRQLVNDAGVPEENIYVGDPLKYIYKHAFDLWTAEFPNVHYMAYSSEGHGREALTPAETPIMKFSDRGTELDVSEDAYYLEMQDADYLINLPTMKAHARAGITLFAKNHFGSHTRDNAEHMHPGLVAPNNKDATRTEMGMYRVQVDLMGHERIGGNTMIFLLDALYSGSEATDPPTKWDMPPFNGDWTSSVFASLDHVAIESVAFDFLRTEYNGEDDKVNYPNMAGVDDYLHQAASKEWWPDGVVYDPEEDGTEIGSLGVHEHWNNPIDKQYTGNLGIEGGITLESKLYEPTSVKDEEVYQQEIGFELQQNYPNPFNAGTQIRFKLPHEASVTLNIYDTTGELIRTLAQGRYQQGIHTAYWNGARYNGQMAASGMYIYELRAQNRYGLFRQTQKMIMLK